MSKTMQMYRLVMIVSVLLIPVNLFSLFGSFVAAGVFSQSNVAVQVLPKILELIFIVSLVCIVFLAKKIVRLKSFPEDKGILLVCATVFFALLPSLLFWVVYPLLGFM